MKTYIPFLFVGAMGLAFADQGTTHSKYQSLGTAKPVQVKNLGPVAVAESNLKIIKKPAKTFRKKYLTTDGTLLGQPLTPGTKVQTPNGNLNASDLLDGTNSLESTLNGLGSSLYDDENDTKTPLVKIEPVTLDLNAQASKLSSLGGMKGATPIKATRDVSAEINSVRSNPLVFNGNGKSPKATLPKGTSATVNPNVTISGGGSSGTRPPVGGSTGTRPKGGGKTGTGRGPGRFPNQVPRIENTGTVAAATAVIPQTIDKKYTLLNESYGDRDWFSIDLDASLTKHADMKLRKVSANADIAAYLIGKKMSLFHAKVEAGGTRDLGASNTMLTPGGPQNPTRPGGRRAGQRNSGSSSSSSNQSITTMEASLVGDDLFSPVSKTTSGRTKKNLTGRNVNWEYSIKIPVIPTVNAVGTVGVKGSMGIDLIVNADSSGGDITLMPNFDTSIYAEGGVEVSLIVASVEGGLGAEMTLLDYDLRFTAGVTPAITNIGDDSYYAASTPIEVTQTMESLSGRVYGFAKVSYWLPFKTHEKTLWNGNLFKWSGFTDSRTLLSEDTEAVIIGKSPIKIATVNSSVFGG